MSTINKSSLRILFFGFLAMSSAVLGVNQQKALKFHERYSVHQAIVTPSIIVVYGLARVR